MAELHFVECDLIQRGKRISYFPERDPDDMARVTTIGDIIAGQIENVRRVWCWDTERGTMEDVSLDIADAILMNASEEPRSDLLEFLEEHCGCQAVAEHLREVETVGA